MSKILIYEAAQIENEYLKRCPTLCHQETQNKAVRKFHMYIKIDEIPNTDSLKSYQGFSAAVLLINDAKAGWYSHFGR